jgi:hypothetical protein
MFLKQIQTNRSIARAYPRNGCGWGFDENPDSKDAKNTSVFVGIVGSGAKVPE